MTGRPMIGLDLGKFRLNDIAIYFVFPHDPLFGRAASTEVAAFGGIGRAGYITLQNDAPLFALRLSHRIGDGDS